MNIDTKFKVGQIVHVVSSNNGIEAGSVYSVNITINALGCNVSYKIGKCDFCHPAAGSSRKEENIFATKDEAKLDIIRRITDL